MTMFIIVSKITYNDSFSAYNVYANFAEAKATATAEIKKSYKRFVNKFNPMPTIKHEQIKKIIGANKGECADKAMVILRDLINNTDDDTIKSGAIERLHLIEKMRPIY